MRYLKWAAALLSCFLVLPVAAATLQWGPKQYVVASGPPRSETVQFAAPAAQSCGEATYVLRAQATGVSSASVVLNGITVFAESAFNGKAVTAERLVRLSAQNSIATTVQGGSPGGSLTLSLVQYLEQEIDGRRLVIADLPAHFEYVVTTSGEETALIVENGDGSEAVAEVDVRVNGVAVAAMRDLRGDVQRVRGEGTFRTGENRVSVTLRGRRGAGVRISTRRVLQDTCGPTIVIESPLPQAIVTGPVIVRGTATGPADVGVTVDGRVAGVDRAHAGTAADPFVWAVAVDAVSAGPLTLVAQAQTTDGTSAQATVIVNGAPAASTGPSLRVAPAVGVAPQIVDFVFDPGDWSSIAGYELDLDGDGVFEAAGTGMPQPASTTYNTSGLRIVTARFHGTEGQTHTAVTVVTVLDYGALYRLLKQQWAAFGAALAAGDIERALAYVAGVQARERYRSSLELIRPSLPEYAASLADLHAQELRGTHARFLLVRVEDGRKHGYPVFFAPDGQGIWRIIQF